jgi:hypothetical protein
MFSSKMYIYTYKPSKVLFTVAKLLMADEVTRIDGTGTPTLVQISESHISL